MQRPEAHPANTIARVPTLSVVIDDRRVAVVISFLLALAAGLGSAMVSPRGPTSATNALLVMGLALLAGLLAGAMTRSRWILVPAFAMYWLGLELGRVDVVGASLQLRFDTTFGVIAFLITRGLHAVLVLPAMALGVALGTALARRTRREADAPRGLPIGTAVLATITIGLAVLVAWPASTPPVLDPAGRPVPGSIAELTRVQLGDHEATVMLRAADPDAPVLLYLSGGPGQSDLAFVRALTTGWVNEFVVATFDQRGNGTSYPAIDPVEDMTVDGAIADVIAITDYLRSRFGEERIYLMGESWGTILGVLAVQQRPDLYHAWLGSGQMVNVLETDRRIYGDLVAYAEQSGDTALAETLVAAGEPPYRDFPWTNSNMLVWYDLIYKDYTPSAGYVARGEAAGLADPFGASGSEYGFIDKANVVRGLLDTFAVLYPQLYAIDFRESVRRLEVPVYILDGAAELEGRRALLLDWFDTLEAPSKQLVTYEGAAHSVAFEQADEVQRLLSETVVPETYGK